MTTWLPLVVTGVLILALIGLLWIMGRLLPGGWLSRQRDIRPGELTVHITADARAFEVAIGDAMRAEARFRRDLEAER